MTIQTHRITFGENICITIRLNEQMVGYNNQIQQTLCHSMHQNTNVLDELQWNPAITAPLLTVPLQ